MKENFDLVLVFVVGMLLMTLGFVFLDPERAEVANASNAPIAVFPGCECQQNDCCVRLELLEEFANEQNEINKKVLELFEIIFEMDQTQDQFLPPPPVKNDDPKNLPVLIV